ncbi:MAG: haloacid dehalogenase-like hydrolase [Succinivibrio sp.]|nr:haloacid dehalogenase-like hydrolase [Succinivibrio sp.]
MKFKSGIILLCSVLILSACSTTTGQNTALQYWSENSAARQSISSYVEEVCNPDSPKFVPVEDRIAVFDFDGTLFGEKYPSYYDMCLFLYRVLEDPDYKAPAKIRAFGRQLKEATRTGKYPKNVDLVKEQYAAAVFKGMTAEQFKDYVKAFRQSEAAGFKNLKRGDAFFKPMVSLVDYLRAHDFDVYICSGSERNLVRALIDGRLNIGVNKVIGSDYTMKGSRQDEDALRYTLSPKEELIMDGELIKKNLKTNKTIVIEREIGKRPLLAFGNSTGDLAMAQYTVDNQRYEARAYLILGDDLERDYGNLKSAEKLKQYCDEHGFETISTVKDFATIYGDEVTLVK